jgi:hypothetical protein
LCKAGGIRLISAEYAPQYGAINFTDGWRQCITTDAACSNYSESQHGLPQSAKRRFYPRANHLQYDYNKPAAITTRTIPE